MAAWSPYGRDRRGTRATPPPEFRAIPAAGRDISRTVTIRVNIGFRARPGSVKTRFESPRQGCPRNAKS
jgi:hypothetical protein